MTHVVHKQVPSIGRIVHVFDAVEDSPIVPLAALITWADPNSGPEGAVDVVVFGNNGFSFHEGIPYGPGKVDCWGWPEFVPPVTVITEDA